MAFKNAMTGGACQADGQQTGVNQNAFTSMIDNFITGDAAAKQRAEGYGPQQQWNQQNMQALDQQYNQMMKQNLMNKQFQQMNIQQPSQQTNYFQHQAERPSAQADLNSLWDNANSSAQQMQQNQPMMQEHHGQMGFRQPFMSPAMMGAPMYQPHMFQQNPMMTQPQQQAKVDVVEEEKVEEKMEGDKEEVKATTGSMIDILQNSSNPKFRNSKFLKFLKKLNTGAYKIEEDSLVKDSAKLEDFRDSETARLQQEQMKDYNEEEKINTDSRQNMFSKLWNENEDMNEETFDNMMKQWEDQNMDSQFNEQFMEEWGKAWQSESMQKPSQIPFTDSNPFKDRNDNFKLAQQLIEDGKTQEAITCLQAEVQKNQDNAEAWRQMGQLYQENDQDDYAIIAFKKAYAIDPYDLDSLICLGISCTNELGAKEATQHLQSWLKYHPDFCGLQGVQDEQADFDLVRKAFEEAYHLKPQDTNVLLALGVLSFIQKNYNHAASYFELAIRENPTDHSLWNKYGAALANRLDTEKAIHAYQQAIDLRPNYVRTLANIGLGYNNIASFKEAAPYFLNALLLNPEAHHIWDYVRRSFFNMNRFDLVEKINLRDPNAFRDEFQLIDLNSLPKQSLDRLYENEIWNSSA